MEGMKCKIRRNERQTEGKNTSKGLKLKRNYMKILRIKK